MQGVYHRATSSASLHASDDLYKQARDAHLPHPRHGDCLCQSRRKQYEYYQATKPEHKAQASLHGVDRIYITTCLASSHSVLWLLSQMESWRDMAMERSELMIGAVMKRSYRASRQKLPRYAWPVLVAIPPDLRFSGE